MPTYKIRGISVDFPYEAYDCQLVYMDKVIQSLQEKCNALLESPTGTGKTLCLLCATLAWRKSFGAFSTGRNVREGQSIEGSQSDISLSQSKSSSLPSIVYTSRTHSQIRQVIQELKRTSYRPKMVVLGSREQLCIHEEVSLLRGSAQTNACHYLCKRRTKRFCGHYNRVADFLKKNPSLGDEPIDIEDLVNVGRSCGPCPYYLSREIHKVVDILFAPYNYLIENRYRKSLNLVWENTILIFDEAHNLEGLCADAASVDLPSGLLTACISEAKKCIDLSIIKRDIDNSNDKAHKPDNYAILRALLLKLEKRISEVPIESKELGFTKPGPYMYELLGDLNITHETANMLIDIIEEAALLLEEDSNVTDGAQKTKAAVCRLESISDIFQRIFRDGGKTHAQYYRVHVQDSENNATDAFKGKGSRTLSWWCFNPGFAMEEFTKMNVRSIILTSGTLSPMESFAQELKLEFPVRLENPHVISENQIWAGVVSAGPSGCSFNSSYRTRDSIEYKQDLGNAIVNFARIVPDGLLVFFPSYYFLDQCIVCWKTSENSLSSNTIWERICKHKQPVVEPRQSSLFSLSIEDYMAKLKDTSTSGAVFFAVCRGKVSEGLDFADHAGRAVVVIGVPFAARNDPKVRLKREYLDEQSQSQLRGCKVLTGEEWYSQQASRAVNQAVGRVIRHRDDYGAILFCDERFGLPNRQSQVSLWIQPHIKCYSKFGDVVFTLTRFFKRGVNNQLTKPKLLPAEAGNSSSISTPKPIIGERIHVFQPENVSSEPSDLGQDFTSISTLKPIVGERIHVSSSVNVLSESSDLSHGSVQKNETASVDKVYLEKFFSSVGATARKDCCVQSFPCTSDIQRSNIPNKYRDITPANRSSLQLCKKNQSSMLQHSSDLFQYQKKLLTPRVKLSNNETIDLMINSAIDEEPVKQGLIIPSPTKKPKLLIGDFSAAQCPNKPYEQGSVVQKAQSSSSTYKPMKPEKSQGFDSRDEHLDGQDKVAEFVSNRGVQSDSASNHDSETRGTAFLDQVKEKLSVEEYQKFRDFMKALKSKSMKIGQVLQSIVSLFSAPGRKHLLIRFKDFIPAKYHPLYEQHLTANGRIVGS